MSLSNVSSNSFDQLLLTFTGKWMSTSIIVVIKDGDDVTERIVLNVWGMKIEKEEK